jgi:hypothetical protein
MMLGSSYILSKIPIEVGMDTGEVGMDTSVQNATFLDLSTYIRHSPQNIARDIPVLYRHMRSVEGGNGTGICVVLRAY